MSLRGQAGGIGIHGGDCFLCPLCPLQWKFSRSGSQNNVVDQAGCAHVGGDGHERLSRETLDGIERVGIDDFDSNSLA